MASLQDIERILLVGIVATAVLDTWLILLGRMGVPTLNFAFVGRWVGHLTRGTIMHAGIARSTPIRGELALGWFTHYAIGISFAWALLVIQGMSWSRQPTLWPCLLFGLCTVLMPLFVMQPAMGAGFASSRTTTPVKNVIRSVANHVVFGLGLYLSCLLAAQWLR